MDGLLVVAAGHDHRYLDAALRPGVPAVFLDRPPGGIEADTVVLDNVVAARMATRHLLAHGHRRIAFVGDAATVTTSADRLSGYLEALTEAGIARDETLIRLNPAGVDAAQASTRQLLGLERPPTAFLAQNNRNCVGIMRAMRSVGEMRALVGIDDLELADMLFTPVTVISHDPADMGRTGAELLFARMAGDSRPIQRITIPVRLIARGSGELPPAP
jgi:LacI family transcriptional regulator